ncbi:hypothetical protein, partial [Bifidobacterium pseudocatenulatum]|uniref:hypothetical protein n=1 Tax=Bifidobacterium pseudocatenulatum TaxID=28026 RepID=UPI0034A34400
VDPVGQRKRALASQQIVLRFAKLLNCTRLIGKSSLTPACGGLSHGCAVESGCFANHFDPIRGGRSPEREFFVCDT